MLHRHMGWLWLVGSIKLYVSFAKEPYKRDDILQKRPIILSILLTVATPYELCLNLICVATPFISDTCSSWFMNTLHHTATHCNTLQHTATHCNTLQYSACSKVKTSKTGVRHTFFGETCLIQMQAMSHSYMSHVQVCQKNIPLGMHTHTHKCPSDEWQYISTRLTTYNIKSPMEID